LPPPGAGVAFVAALAAARVAGAGLAATGLTDGEVFGLKKSASVFFAGDGDGEGAGLAAASAFAFLCARGFAGDGDAEAAAVLSAAGEAAAVASAFLCVRCFAGEGDAAGDSLGVGD